MIELHLEAEVYLGIRQSLISRTAWVGVCQSLEGTKRIGTQRFALEKAVFPHDFTLWHLHGVLCPSNMF